MQGGLFSTVEHPQSQFASLEYITNHRYAWFFKQHVVQMMCVILLDYLDNHETIASSMHLTAEAVYDMEFHAVLFADYV